MKRVATIVLLLVAASSLSKGDDQCIATYGTARVREFLYDLQDSVAKNDQDRIAQMIEFPITIQADGHPKKLRNRADFLKFYDVAFDQKVKGFIAKQQGVMIGRGEIWINRVGRPPKLKIIAINNNPPWSPEDK